jgi:hypothetical protein
MQLCCTTLATNMPQICVGADTSAISASGFFLSMLAATAA